MKLIAEPTAIEQYLNGEADRSTLLRWRRAGLWPEPIKFAGGRNFYLESEIIGAIERQVVKRDARAQAVAAVRAS